MEARQTGLESDPVLADRMAEGERTHLLELYEEREIDDQILVAEEEILQHFYDTLRHRALRFAGAVVETREEALQIAAQMRAGSALDQPPDGLYLRKNQVNPHVANALFRLTVGDVSPPLPIPLENGLAHGVFKVLDERSVPLKEWRREIFRELFGRRQRVLREALCAALLEKYPAPAASDPLDFSPLFLAEAEALGLRDDPTFRDRLERQRGEELVRLLRERQVEPRAQVSAVEARAFYDRHPELFPPFRAISIAEVLVRDKALARHVKREMQKGIDAEKLALLYSVRPGAAQRGGLAKLTPFTTSHSPEIYQQARDLAVSTLAGPLQVEEGYSVFKVLEKGERTARYEGEIEDRALELTRREQMQKRLTAYIRDLRKKYAAGISPDRRQ